MNSIEEIDDNLSESINILHTIANDLAFNTICEFKLNKHHIQDIPWETFHYPGLYLIEIKNQTKFKAFSQWVDDFEKKWANEKYVRSFTSNLKKKRIIKHTELEDWIPLYIGKSQRIEGRVHEHIFKELHKTTYALKLNARDNLFDEIFRLKTLRIEVKNYNMILPFLEKFFRDKINPIIGKQ